MNANAPPAFQTFWAKTSATQTPPWHPAAFHCLDVAAVGCEILSRCPALVRRMADMTGVAEEVLRATLPFLIALHDLGKFTHPFQVQVAALWPSVLGPPGSAPAAPRHELAGFFLLWDKLDFGHLRRKISDSNNLARTRSLGLTC
jgi:CRISPR-associated endonuclease/helicase Cas3